MNQNEYDNATITMTTIMIMITIIDMIKSIMTGMSNQTWEELGKGEEYFQVNVQEMDIIMTIGLKVFIVSKPEQARGPVQDPVYFATFRKAQEQAFHRKNNISPNLDVESSVSWTRPESINYEIEITIANFRAAQQLLAAQDNQEQLNQQAEQPILTGATHTPQIEAPDYFQLLSTG
ncbi:MAG: hypothetical protein EZS28_006934 [Streblomastix strix]|uniref:Uncharacterized protein n=1 Tax=Streblomastix strix TaxID=222440 RepID=A0A5J4WSM3_9EUKA|nr:MAG: hypothetical protein EZS28_006934 [Streblomastix strix]